MDSNDLHKLMHFINHIFSDSVTWRIIRALSRTEGLTLRELARRSEIAPKTLYKYIDALQRKGVVEIYRPGPRVMIIKLSERYAWLRQYLGHT